MLTGINVFFYNMVRVPEGRRLKRKGSKLGMLLGIVKRERSGSKSSKGSKGSDDDYLVAYEDHDEFVSKLKRQSKRSARSGTKLTTLFGSRSENPRFVPTTDSMIRLETVIQSDKGRKDLIQELMVLKGCFSVKVRFCAAVDTFDAADEDDEDKKVEMAAKLIETFLVPGSMFYVPMSDARREAIMKGNVNQLLAAKREVLEELSNNESVMQIVDHVEGLDGV
jgi:hypothetical protein